MPSRRQRHRRSLVVKATELAFAAPQVVAHRVARMALAGTSPAARDRKEFQQMGVEKMAAFFESWNAMTIQALRPDYEAVASLWRSWWTFWSSGKTSTLARSQFLDVAYGIMSEGIGPVHRRAVANAKRLARASLR
jgi:hypothetical protein